MPLSFFCSSCFKFQQWVVFLRAEVYRRKLSSCFPVSVSMTQNHRNWRLFGNCTLQLVDGSGFNSVHVGDK